MPRHLLRLVQSGYNGSQPSHSVIVTVLAIVLVALGVDIVRMISTTPEVETTAYLWNKNHAMRRNPSRMRLEGGLVDFRDQMQGSSNYEAALTHYAGLGNGFDKPVKVGVSLIAACRNRGHIIPKVLRNWLSIEGLGEIILVDWSSDVSLKSAAQDLDDTRLKIMTVEGEISWCLTRAYNLALSVVSFDKVLRVDCDHFLTKDFLVNHTMLNQSFYSGSWQAARNTNEVHLNGAGYFTMEALRDVFGYDERIQTYGWDDEDLYFRLTNAGYRRLALNYDSIAHIPHGDALRAQSGVKFVDVEVDFNRLMLDKVASWNSQQLVSKYQILEEHRGFPTTLRAVGIPDGLDKLLSEQQRMEAWLLALGRRLHDTFGVPWDVIQGMQRQSRETLLRRLLDRQSDLGDSKKPMLVIVHVKHGLGNRLRALASAAAFANNTGRELIVNWEADEHCGAHIDDLFDAHGSALVFFSTKLKWPLSEHEKYDHAWHNFDSYNYMETEGHGASKGRRVIDDPSKHIYYKGAYVMEAGSLVTWETENLFLRSLRPIDAIVRILTSVPNLDSMVGAHIRSRDMVHDISGVNYKREYGSEAAETLEYWRNRSSYATFEAKISEILRDNPTQSFFLACDTQHILNRLRAKFGDHVVFIRRDCEGREVACIRYALVDILALSRTKYLLGSNWSSFTELVERLSGRIVLRAGIDFGNATTTHS